MSVKQPVVNMIEIDDLLDETGSISNIGTALTKKASGKGGVTRA